MSAVLVLLAVLNLAASPTATAAPTLTGTWRSAVQETPLSSSFDESVWGKNAKSTRVVEMVVKPTGDDQTPIGPSSQTCRAGHRR